jgi:hypothetical protein
VFSDEEGNADLQKEAAILQLLQAVEKALVALGAAEEEKEGR